MSKEKKTGVPEPQKRPTPIRVWGYLAGAALCLLGLMLLGVAVGQALRTAIRGVTPFSIPGSKAFAVNDPGLYVGVYVHKSEEPMPLAALSGLNIRLTETATGARLPLEQPPAAQVFRQGGQQGVLLFQCAIPSTGTFLIDAEYAAAASSGPALDAVLINEAVQHGRADMAVGVLLFLACAGFGIYLIIKTRRMKPPDTGGKR